MKDIYVSIITVCYNSEATIERTLKSVLNQTYRKLEYIIVDGKSTDHTLDIVKRYEPLFGGRMKIISEPDSGIYDAMNKGISKAKGDLIGIINSDDYYKEDAVKIMVSAMGEQPYQILYGKLSVHKQSGETSIVMPRHENLSKEMIAHPTCFVTKKVYDDFGAFNIKYRSCADHDFMLRMRKCREIVFVPVEQIIAGFTDGTGMSANEASVIEAIGMLTEQGLFSKVHYWLIKMKYHVKKILNN